MGMMFVLSVILALVLRKRKVVMIDLDNDNEFIVKRIKYIRCEDLYETNDDGETLLEFINIGRRAAPEGYEFNFILPFPNGIVFFVFKKIDAPAFKHVPYSEEYK
jgi:hypothetical protein